MAFTSTLSFLAGIVFGAISGTWYTHFMGRPNIKNYGSGSGQSDGPWISQISFTNRRRFIGLRFLPSVVFGRSIHGYWEWGLWIDVCDAVNMSAHLFDKDTGQHVVQLLWKTSNGFEPYINLKSNENATLEIFGASNYQAKSYFPIQRSSNQREIIVPPDKDHRTDARDYEIRISYNGSYRPKIFCFQVKKDFNGTISMLTP